MSSNWRTNRRKQRYRQLFPDAGTPKPKANSVPIATEPSEETDEPETFNCSGCDQVRPVEGSGKSVDGGIQCARCLTIERRLKYEESGGHKISEAVHKFWNQ